MKAERREKKRNNNRKMGISGRSIFNLLRIRANRIIDKIRDTHR